MTTNEVYQFLSKLDINVPEAERERITNDLDRNGNGTIEFVEFVKSYAKGLFGSFGGKV